jgi:acetyltransferase-like isoleucine patch superfamily enzyme
VVKKIFYFILSLRLGKEYYAKKIGVRIGKGCRIYTYSFGSEPFLISIGNKVTITKGVTFITHDGSTWLISDKKGRRYLFRRIEIGDNVFIGMNSIILPGIKIGDNVIIAAGSVLTKSIPSNSVVGGNPAKLISTFESYKSKVLKNYISEDIFNEKIGKDYQEIVNQIVDNSFKANIST